MYITPTSSHDSKATVRLKNILRRYRVCIHLDVDGFEDDIVSLRLLIAKRVAVSLHMGTAAATAVARIACGFLGALFTIGEEDVMEGLETWSHHDERCCDNGDVVFDNDDSVCWNDDP